MSKLKFALAMLAAGGATGVASQAAAKTVVLDIPGMQDFTDISLEGGPAQFYYGFDTTAEKTFLGAYGDSLLMQPGAPFGPGGFSDQRVKTAFNVSFGGPPKYLSVNGSDDQFIRLTFSAGADPYHGYADVKPGGTLHSISYGAGTSGAVPEPAAWALMIAGFGLTGAALRRRQRQVPLTA